ncbi:LysR substrate-binding domain-containing protein [Chelativorans sp. AA-79]|uniref:LysR substrate-binding domain-containing protein n=1 Tax=Chelativorans sp. AA-79 TaxID=3028735 RepID=UPI0023F96E88|nr:LysR substrate-binding domain-containing protein [Chelativorans sp. AA-79]WEX08270.1 LysR substrate-binding domain-containing protein [Chelativorans sp. AA-79]
MLSQRALEAFRAVMESGSVSGAADMLNVSQPAVSRLIRDLEESVGMSLFLRMGGKIVPTPEARELVMEVERAFIGLGTIEQAARDIRHGLRGAVSIASMPALAQSILPDALMSLHRARPDSRIELLSMRTHNVIRQVASRQCQIGFTAPTQHQFDIDLIDTYALGYRCIMPAGHPLEEQEVVRVKDFAGIAFVGFNETTATGRMLERHFATLNTPPLIMARSHLSSIISAMVLRGMGAAVVDPFTARIHERAGGSARTVELEDRFMFAVIRPLGQKFSSDIEALLLIFNEIVAGFEGEEGSV